jgi:GTP-binding protein
VLDAETKLQLADLVKDGDSYTVVRGGRGGRGNARFASSTNQAPRYAQKGEEGKEIRLNLQIKFIADVGIVGLPNAGKTTLLSVMTNARPKIAGYPFTTLSPNLGVMKYGDEKEFVLADVPGLIEGASRGLGLGIRFLKHIERTGMLLFLLDLSEGKFEEHYATLVNELRSYSETLLKKPRLIVGSKLDCADEEVVKDFLSTPFDGNKIAVSSVARRGIDPLKREIAALVEDLNGH